MGNTVDAARCEGCGTLSYPTHFTCPDCGEIRFQPVPIEGEGTLMTWTRAYALPLDFTDRFITLGIVEMDLGVRVTGRLEIDEPSGGSRVRASVERVREIGGKEISGLVFRAA